MYALWVLWVLPKNSHFLRGGQQKRWQASAVTHLKPPHCRAVQKRSAPGRLVEMAPVRAPVSGTGSGKPGMGRVRYERTRTRYPKKNGNNKRRISLPIADEVDVGVVEPQAKRVNNHNQNNHHNHINEDALILPDVEASAMSIDIGLKATVVVKIVHSNNLSSLLFFSLLFSSFFLSLIL